MSEFQTSPLTPLLTKEREHKGEVKKQRNSTELKKGMTKHYNKPNEKEKRRKLRKNQTYVEKIVWIYLRDRRLLGYKFKRQYSVDYYVIDFYCPELKFAIELDGECHDPPEQKEYDAKRQKYLEDYGIEFIRITNDELLGNPNKAFERIENAIKARKARIQKQGNR